MHIYAVFRENSAPVQLLGNFFDSHSPMDMYMRQSGLKSKAIVLFIENGPLAWT